MTKMCVAPLSGHVGLDGLDATHYTCLATEWYSGVWSSDSSVGVRRTCNQTTLWILCFVLEAPQAG